MIKNFHRSGMTLLEIAIGITLGSILFLILFQSLQQSSRVSSKIHSIGTLERQVFIFYKQFQSDFDGIIAAPKKTVEKNTDKNDNKENDQKTTKLDKETENKILSDFICLKKNNQIVETISFLSTNPLKLYKQESLRLVRIAYKCIPDPENTDAFLLVRQQSDELSWEKFNAASNSQTRKDNQKIIRSYEIIRNIVSISINLFVLVIDIKKKTASDNKETTAPFYKIFSEHDYKSLSAEDKKKYSEPTIPFACSIDCVIKDDAHKEHSFHWIITSHNGIQPFFKKTSEQQKSSEKNTQQPTYNHTGEKILNTFPLPY